MNVKMKMNVIGQIKNMRDILMLFLSDSPVNRRRVKRFVILVTMLMARGNYVLSGVLLFCSLNQRDYYGIESPGWILIVPVFMAVLAIKLVRMYRIKNSLVWGVFFAIFAWLLVMGYIQAYLDYIYPDSLFCLA